MLNFDFENLFICIFALRIGKNDKWRLAYCIVTPAQEKMNELVVSGSSKLVSNISIRNVKWSGEQDVILGIYDDLSHGISLKSSLDIRGVESSLLDFDVEYSQEAVIEPWGNEQILNSQLSYTKSVSMLNPLKLIEKDGQIPDNAKKLLQELENYLSKQTKLPFGKKFDHVGNLDIIIAPDRDSMGRPLVENHFEKGKPFIQHIKLHKELLKTDDELLINIICKQDGRVIKDTVDKLLISKVQDINKEYSMDNCPDSIEVKIWRVRQGKSMVIYDTQHYIIKQIQTRIELVETVPVIGEKWHQWLQKIRNNVPKEKRCEVDDKSIIERGENMPSFIGEPVKKRLQRKAEWKCNDYFFPQGWNKEDEEHGLLSFIEWFKRKAKGAKSIFLQDPYFEYVAMYFLATADINSECTVLTQTKLKTNPDGTCKVDEGDDSNNRKDCIVESIKNNPKMFGSMKLVIKDISCNNKVLHDRYLFFDYGNSKLEAYMLSNSFQGATTKQPLLVSQIGDAAFEKVSAYISEMCDNREDVETIYNYSEIKASNIDGKIADKVADRDFFEKLKQQEKKLKKGNVNQMLKDIKVSNSYDTYKQWSTLGHFLSTINDDESNLIINNIASTITEIDEWIEILKGYILSTYNDNFPIGYSNTPFGKRLLYDPSYLLGLKYKEIVTPYHINMLDNIGCESCSYGVYGHFYAAKLLLRLSVKEYVNILKQLHQELLKITTDKTISPCYMVIVVLLIELMESDFMLECDDVKSELLKNGEEWCRGVGSLILLQKVKEEDFPCEDFCNLLENKDELITLCHTAWGMKPAPSHMDMFYKLLTKWFCNKGEKTYFLNRLFADILGGTHFTNEKIDYMKHVTLPVIKSGLVDKDELSREMIEALYDKSIGGQHALIMRDVLPECLFIVDGDISLLYEKAEKTVRNTNENIQKIALKNEDNILEELKKCIELRVVLILLIEKYKEGTNITIEKIKPLLDDLDKELDGYGLERVKRSFENLKLLAVDVL